MSRIYNSENVQKFALKKEVSDGVSFLTGCEFVSGVVWCSPRGVQGVPGNGGIPRCSMGLEYLPTCGLNLW